MQIGILIGYALFIIKLSHSKLLFVYEHFRHGAREPIEGIDKDNKDYLKFEWNNFGELTSVGERMHYLLGVRNKRLYAKFLSPRFNSKELLVMSTNTNRTIQSALSHLQGMYTPSNIPLLTDEQVKLAYPPNPLSEEAKRKLATLGNNALEHNIEVVPIHLFNKIDKCYLLYEPSGLSGCVPVDEIRNINRQHKNIIDAVMEFNKAFGAGFKQFFDNKKNKELETFPFLITLCDHFMADLYDGRTLTPLSDLKIDLIALEAMCVKMHLLQHKKVVFGDFNNDLIKIGMTSAMKQILHHMNKRIEFDKKGDTDMLDNEAPKFVIHSAHDSSLIGIQMVLNIAFGTEIIYPRYASNSYFELHKNDTDLHNDDSDYSVKYIYEDKNIKTIPYPEFKKNITDLFKTDEEISLFCRTPVPNSSQRSLQYLLISVVVFLGVICALIIAAIVYFYITVIYPKNKQNFTSSSDANEQMLT